MQATAFQSAPADFRRDARGNDPAVGAIAGYGPPVIFLAGPWLLLALMLSGPFLLTLVPSCSWRRRSSSRSPPRFSPRRTCSSAAARCPGASRVQQRSRPATRPGQIDASGKARTVGRACKVSDTDAASFQIVRRRLFGIAYRVLGSASEADDVVQDAWIRWQRTDRGTIRDPAAFLATMTERLALTVGQSARARHEISSGPLQADAVDLRRRSVTSRGAGRSARARAARAAGEAVRDRASGLHPSRGVRLSPPKDRRRAGAQRGKRAADRHSRARAPPRRTTPTCRTR